jgi:sugar phosphate isomerase/epimerase
MMRFGISTSLFGDERPGAEQFDLIAEHGFTVIELAAGFGHFDWRDGSPMVRIRTALLNAGLELAGISIPIADVPAALGPVAALGNPLVVAIADGCEAHLPHPHRHGDFMTFRREAEQAADHAARHRIALAIEPPAGFLPDETERLLESLEDGGVGVCLDVGHAHMRGGAPEAIEILSGYILTAHLHDNNRREDSHRLPYDGSVDWPETLMALWKTGYTGAGIFEFAPAEDVKTTLARAVGARTRLQAILDDLAQPMIFPE